MDRRRRAGAADGGVVGRGGDALVAVAGGGAGRGGDALVAAAGGGAGRGDGAPGADAGGAGRGGGGLGAEAAGGAGRGEVAIGPDVRQGRDDRVLAEREAFLPWMGPNPNQEPGSSKGMFERKGIFLDLHPKEFEEIILKKKYIVKNEKVNSANRELVKLYNEVQRSRLRSFWVIRKGAVSKQGIIELKNGYELKMQQVKVIKESIEKLNGTAVPIPPHFGDRKVIFGIQK